MQYFKGQSNETGAAMMISVIFFIVISTVIVVGLTGPAAREFRVANDAITSKQSYFLGESGVEDAFYRLKTNKQLGTSETIVLGDTTTTTTITTLTGGTKEIVGTGDTRNREREVKLRVTTGAGVSFNYGVQVGQGGIDLQGSGTVNGNVYANGPITGDSSGAITGTAISANSPSLTADQSNGVPAPANNISFGNANGTQDIAQQFQLSTSGPINKIQLYLRKQGNPSNATVRIVGDNAGAPGSTIYASGTLTASNVTTTYGWIDVSFTANPVLPTGTDFWLIVDAATSSSNYYILGANANGYTTGISKIGQYNGTWNNTTPANIDYFFKVFLGGFTGLIQGNSLSQWNQLHIGTTSGTAQAQVVNYTNATGNIHCTTGTGNNKSCSALTPPAFIAFPVSDAQIDAWKIEADAGGTLTGNYSVGYAGATVGPKKLAGNLSISGGGTLTVTGTLWVTGNLNLSGGGDIVLASSYGTNDGIIVVDGTITVSGGTSAGGSGQTGSYLMILTTNPGTNAVNLSGGSGAVILYAPYGTMNISGGASLKEATAYKINISGGSSITYESGLSNMNFSSGPSGSYNISTWREN